MKYMPGIYAVTLYNIAQVYFSDPNQTSIPHSASTHNATYLYLIRNSLIFNNNVNNFQTEDLFSKRVKRLCPLERAEIQTLVY